MFPAMFQASSKTKATVP